MPDDVLLNFVNLRRAFFDIKSKERETDIVKPKYKLLTQKGLASNDLEVYIFHNFPKLHYNYKQQMHLLVFHLHHNK